MNSSPFVDKIRDKSEIVVSVAMITYNHEPFIAQAIESVLMQKRIFRVELVIGEDCSTDRTREVVTRYAQQHPELVRGIFHKRNVGFSKNLCSVLESCRGEYIALIEGDDFWTDPHKLEAQVDFLERNPDCALCFHDAEIQQVDQKGTILNCAQFFQKPPKHRLAVDDFVAGFYPHTASCLFSNDKALLQPLFDEKMLAFAKCVFYCVMSAGGKAGFLDRVMSVYRMHSGGMFSSLSPEQQLQMSIDGLLPAWRYFREHGLGQVFSLRLGDTYMQLALIYLKEGRISRFIGSYLSALFHLCIPLTFRGAGKLAAVHGGIIRRSLFNARR